MLEIEPLDDAELMGCAGVLIAAEPVDAPAPAGERRLRDREELGRIDTTTDAANSP
ncbi:hypothetical protein ACFOWZ_19520 [Lentzea rhizosphaerae]|uniref:Uncharacterized protein n=1 Tax=Lentzea rhizosphaerae TaxID=2041025 RepID=A0ABV8BW57_9PSEU